MLNEYFPTLLEPIERNGGIVNQFQGDAMLVTFNIPIADPQHAQKAVRTAAEIQRVLQGRKFAGVELVTRIGIHTGMVITGNVGSGKRVHYAVYGDAVNLAARLEQLNKDYGCACRKSNSHILMMKSAEKCRRPNATNGMYCSRRPTVCTVRGDGESLLTERCVRASL
jgi:class 3 adenylate cyclase